MFQNAQSRNINCSILAQVPNSHTTVDLIHLLCIIQNSWHPFHRLRHSVIFLNNFICSYRQRIDHALSKGMQALQRVAIKQL